MTEQTKLQTTGSTDVAVWREEMAKRAAAAVKQEAGVGGGQFFSIRGGQLSFNGAPIPGNHMAVIVLDSLNENVFYEEKFDPNDIQAPKCYAFGRDDSEMAPHEQAAEPQCETCKACDYNQWGSGSGRGKACRNRRRLALLSAGNLTDQGFTPMSAAEISVSPVGFLSLPPTSLTAYASFVRGLNGAWQLPPCGVFTRVAVVADKQTQVRVTFESLGVVPVELVPTVLRRVAEIEKTIAFPYPASTGGEVKKSSEPAGRKVRKY